MTDISKYVNTTIIHPFFVLGWRPSLVGWRPLLLGWRPSLVGWRPSLSRLGAISTSLSGTCTRRGGPLFFGCQVHAPHRRRLRPAKPPGRGLRRFVAAPAGVLLAHGGCGEERGLGILGVQQGRNHFPDTPCIPDTPCMVYICLHWGGLRGQCRHIWHIWSVWVWHIYIH